MPARRDLIRMTPDEVAACLAGRRRIVLVSNGREGLPHPVPMNYGLDEQGRVVMTSYARSQKVRNLERDPRAVLLVETGERYQDLKAVILYCDAEILREPDVVRALAERMRAAAGLAQEPIRPAPSSSPPKRVVLRFTPFRTVSWDHAKLGGGY